MKKLLIMFILILFCLPCYCDDNLDKANSNQNAHNKMFVICSPNNKICTVGKHSLTAGSKPLFVSDGIVCTNNKKTCTNGFSYVHSNHPIEIVGNSVLCIENRSICTIGEHKLTSNSKNPLFVEDGIVCTSDKKLCTNGFQYIQANKPLR